jgi:transcriptional regulator with XRE-family HTH domain
MSPFSVYLKKLRTERNLRQATLSAMLNRGQSYISRLETGAAPLPPQSILTKLSAKLQLTSEETQALQTTWATSAKQLTIPRAARPAEFELAHKFV